MVLKAEPPHRKDRAVWDPAAEAARVEVREPTGVRAADLARAPVEVAAKVVEKAAAGGLNKSTN